MIQCNYNTNLKSYNLSSPMNCSSLASSSATTTSSSSHQQHGTASDASSVYSNSEASSLQNTLIQHTQKPQSRLQQPQMNLNRFGFKPASSAAVSLQTSKQVKNPTSPLPDSIPAKKSLTKLYIDESKQLETSKNQSTDKSKRLESPSRPMLKPPNSVAISKQTNNVRKKTESPKELKNTEIRKSGMKESSSVSSISSTTSSNLSSTNQSKTKSVKTKSNLPNPKTLLKPPATTTTTKIASPKPQFQSNLIKPPSIAINNSNNQHKRRLFNPYMPNPSISSNVNNKNLNANESTNNSSKENTLIINSAETIIKKTDGTSMESNQNEIKKSHKFKLYNNSSNSKTQMNVLKNLKISKMPVKSYSLTSNIAAPISKKSSSIQSPSKPQKTVDLESISQNNNRKQCQESLTLNENLIKREDSAYCSSTSSTVSSQEVEINKFPMNNMIQSKSNSEFSSHEEQADELSNCAQLEKPQSPELNKINSIKIDDIIVSQKFELESKDIGTETVNNKNEHEKPDETEPDLIPSQDAKDDQTSELISKNSNQHQPIGKQNSIKESIGELNQLMSTSSIGTNFTDDTNQKTNNIKQRRTSSTSLTHVSGSSSNGESLPMFRPRSNLPPVENSEVIELPIDEYRLLLQDLQNTKTLLYKLFNQLREPSLNSFNNGENCDLQPDENQMTNSFLGSFNGAIINDKFDQSTQTD